MLDIGIIGYGGRISGMAKALGAFGIPYRITAVADPREIEKDDFLKETVFYKTADEMLEKAQDLDGIMIGTRCNLHTEMTLKAADRDIPLFLEKPVAITYKEIDLLTERFRHFKPPTVVSFPLRLTPIVQTVKEIIDSGKIGTVEYVNAFNDVPYGSVYFRTWHRNYEENGGLWLQKATHDLDYVTYLIGSLPDTICAMNAQRIYGGSNNSGFAKHKPFDLKCSDCDEKEECPESPWNLFYQRHEGERPNWGEFKCLFADGIKNEDFGHCLIEHANGSQSVYSQNFFARKNAARRGARISGYKGTIEFDWYRNKIDIHMHHSPHTETIDFSGGMSHFGGDRELCYDFLICMREGTPSRCGIQAGIISALICLKARESCEKREFVKLGLSEIGKNAV